MERTLIRSNTQRDVVDVWSGRKPRNQNEQESRSLKVGDFNLIVPWRAVRRRNQPKVLGSHLVYSWAIRLSLVVGRVMAFLEQETTASTGYPGETDESTAECRRLQ